VVPAHTHSHTQSNIPRSRNGGTTHDETGVEAEGRSRRVEIPQQSQRRNGANVAAGVETGVCSKKTIAPRCRGSRSRGGRGRETRSRSLISGRGRRSSINDRQGDTTKGHRQADLPASSIIRASTSPAREADSSAHVYAGHGVRARCRIEGGNGRSGREGHGSDGSSREDAIQPKGRRIEPERSQQRGSGREGRGSDGSNEGDEGVGSGAGPAGQGPAPDLARGVGGTGDGRSSKWEALLGRQREQLGGG
jgi:hypothetical protein